MATFRAIRCKTGGFDGHSWKLAHECYGGMASLTCEACDEVELVPMSKFKEWQVKVAAEVYSDPLNDPITQS